MNYQIDYSAFSGIFAVPTMVKPLLNSCTGTALKVLLLILSNANETITPARISAELGFPPSDVEEALEYWCKNGVLVNKIQFNNGEVAEQLSLTPMMPTAPTVRRSSGKKILSVQEMDALYTSDQNIRILLQEAEEILRRPLSSPEREILISFYSYDHLSVEYLLLILMYCVEMDKTNFRYIEKMIINMLEKEVDTYDKAEVYLAKANKAYKQEELIRSAFGIYDRAFTQKEKDFIKVWFEDYKFDISVIKLAYESNVNSTGKFAFAYINRILERWHNAGVKTTKEASLEISSKKSENYKANNGFLLSSLDMEDIDKLLSTENYSSF